MKVLVVTNKFAPHRGGTAVVWEKWCQHWPAKDLTVIAPLIPGSRDFDASVGYRVVRVWYPDIPKIRMPFIYLMLAVRALLECLINRPALIHCGQVFETGPVGLVAKKVLNIPYCIHTYGEELVMARRSSWLQALVSRTLQEARMVTSISDFSASLLHDFGYHGECLMVHPGVDSTHYCPGPPGSILADSYAIPPGPKLITVGRLMERKGHASVIALMPVLLESFPDLHYIIVGVGPYEAELKSMVSRTGLNSVVHFLGLVPDAVLPQILRECTVFVHPNRVTRTGDVEGFGIVFLEAAATGLPVVGGDSGGVRDAVLDRQNGLLVNPESREELLEALKLLLSRPEVRKNMGVAGRSWACAHDWASPAANVWERSLEVLPFGLGHFESADFGE
ncbi:glycosyltransferase family 4 protein [bacterium CPR1]|nr:glycosyltransferase family 4 protein [bacterium CPR1]